MREMYGEESTNLNEEEECPGGTRADSRVGQSSNLQGNKEDDGEVLEILETYTVQGTGELKVEDLRSEENVLIKINKLLRTDSRRF